MEKKKLGNMKVAESRESSQIYSVSEKYMYSLFKIDQFDAQKPPLYQSPFTIIQGDWPLQNKIKYKDWPGVVAKW